MEAIIICKNFAKQNNLDMEDVLKNGLKFFHNK